MFQWTDERMGLEIADINIMEFNLGASWDVYYYIKVLMLKQMKKNEQECFWKLLTCCEWWFTSNLGGAIINLVELSITEVEIQWVLIEYVH